MNSNYKANEYISQCKIGVMNGCTSNYWVISPNLSWIFTRMFPYLSSPPTPKACGSPYHHSAFLVTFLLNSTLQPTSATHPARLCLSTCASRSGPEFCCCSLPSCSISLAWQKGTPWHHCGSPRHRQWSSSIFSSSKGTWGHCSSFRTE